MGLIQELKNKFPQGWKQNLRGEVRWLSGYARRFRVTIAVHILLGVAGIVLGLASSVASKYLIDAVTGYNTGAIGLAAACMIGMMAGRILLKAVTSRISAQLDIRLHNEIQANVYRQILLADWQSLEQFPSGDLLNRLNSDVNTIAGSLVGFLPSLLSGLVQFFGAFAIIIYYDPAMALIALLGVPVSVVCSRLMVRKMHSYNRQLKQVSSEVMSFHQDSFQNLTSIKAFGITDMFCGRMDDIQEKYRDTYLSYNRFSVYASAFLSVVGMVVSISCFGWGVYRLWEGAITYGTMTLFLQLSSTLSGSFSSLVGLVPSLISLSTSTQRIMAVTELPGEEQAVDAAFAGETEFSLRLDAVSFSYQDGNSVLENATVVAEPGDLVALTGPSGEGKTTLLRILLGLVAPERGQALLIGGSGREYRLSAATRGAFSYVPQGGSLFSGSIRENMRMIAPGATDEKIWEVLRIACAEDFVRALPDGLDHPIGDRETGLSAGQSQRIAVARALLRGAPILLLDEATSALDEQTESIMLHRLMSSGRVRTCLLVTHRPGALKYCARGYHIHNGVVQEVR